MNDWIPLFQSLVWPFTLLVLLGLLFRQKVLDVFDEIIKRVRGGGAFEAGPSGIKLGAVQRPLSGSDEGNVPPSATKAAIYEGETDSRLRAQFPRGLYIVHTTRKDRLVAPDGDPYYQLRIYLDGDTEEDLNRVEKVIYHLHPTFPIPLQTRSNRKDNFEVRTRAWGEFNLWAEVFLKGETEPIIVERYLNLR